MGKSVEVTMSSVNSMWFSVAGALRTKRTNEEGEAPEKVQGRITKGIVWLVKEIELYSISNRKPFKYGEIITSLFQECDLKNVEDFRWSATS